MANDELTRRTLIRAGSTAVAATIAGVALAPFGTGGIAQAAELVATYVLDPTQGGTCTTGSCVSCQACRLHAANKLFRTGDAAEQGRAHPGCLCTVIAGQTLSTAVSTNVFSLGDMADRRYAQTAQWLNAEVEQKSVPMMTGFVPITVMAGGAAAIAWVAARRRAQLHDTPC